MKQEEFIKSLNYNGHIINIGIDDYGQQYFLEFEKDGKIEEVGCGSYNTDYMYEIENIFGNPTECEKYETIDMCEEYHSHGYCGGCPKNVLVIDREHRNKNYKY